MNTAFRREHIERASRMNTAFRRENGERPSRENTRPVLLCFGGTAFGDEGTITNGHVNGANLSFTRNIPPYTQIWTGRLTSGRIEGSLSGNASCSWEANRK